MPIRISDFKGTFPKIADHALPDGAATIAVNCNLWSGNLVAMRQDPVVHVPVDNGDGNWPVDLPNSATTKHNFFKWNIEGNGGYIFSGTYTELTADPTYNRLVKYIDHGISNGTITPTYSWDGGSSSMPYEVLTTEFTQDDSFKIDAPGFTVSIGEKIDFAYFPSASSKWIIRGVEAEFAKAVVGSDVNKITYITEEGKKPKQAYITGGGSTVYGYDVGVAQGYAAPGVVVNVVGTSPYSRTYIHTMVNTFGQEGLHSLPSAAVSVGTGGNVTVYLTGTNDATFGPYLKNRLYRTVRTSSGTAFKFVRDCYLPDPYDFATGIPFVDSVNDSATGSILPPYSRLKPRTDMRGIISVGNGIMAGYSGNKLCLSVPNQPHAWPPNFEKTVDYDIVGISSYGSNIVVLTKEDVFIGRGTHSENYTVKKVGIDQGCVSRNSISRVGDNGVVYASPDGLVLISDAGVKIVTEELIKVEDWKLMRPDTLVGSVFNNIYYGSHYVDDGSGETTKRTFALDPGNIDRGLVDIDVAFYSVLSDVFSDALFYMDSVTEEDAVIRSFQGTGTMARRSYQWRSKTYRESEPLCYTAAEVICDDYTDVTLKLYSENSDGTFTLKHTEAVANRKPFRMPAGYLTTGYQIELTGKSSVQMVNLARNVSELSAL